MIAFVFDPLPFSAEVGVFDTPAEPVIERLGDEPGNVEL